MSNKEATYLFIIGFLCIAAGVWVGGEGGFWRSSPLLITKIALIVVPAFVLAYLTIGRDGDR